VPTKAARHAGRPVPLDERTELVADLGLVGDDAFEFMERFAEEFQVDTGDFEFTRYFDAEGLSLHGLFKKTDVKPVITLGMLAMAAGLGVWDSRRLQAAAPPSA